MVGQRFTTRSRAVTSIVAGFLTLFVLTLTPAGRAEALSRSASADLPATISRANLDGTGKELNFIETPVACGVTVDAAYVYWGTGDGVGRADLDGSGVDEDFITGVGGFTVGGGDVCAVAVDAAHVYWANQASGSIGRAKLDGTGVNPNFIPGVGGACAVAVDSAHVYWVVTEESHFGVGPGSLGRANLDGSGADPSFIAGDSGYRPTFSCAVAVDAAHIYWGQLGGFDFGVGVGRANLDGTNVEAKNFISGAQASCGIALDASHFYWPEPPYSPSARIARANLDGTGVELTFIIGGNAPCGVALDARHIYWANRGNPSFFSLSGDHVKRDEKRGTATFHLGVPGPGVLKLRGKWLVKATRRATRFDGLDQLPVKPKGKAKKRLNKKGYAKVKARVTYTPDGGEPNTLSKKIRLVKR